MIVDLLQNYLKVSWAGEVEFSTLEKVNASYVTRREKQRHDDLVWRMRFREARGGQWLYLYLLLEFQSTVDRFMVVRLLSYIGLLYEDLIKQKVVKSSEKLPAVLPIVLYHGEPTWTAATTLAELIADLPDDLKPYQPQLHYLLLEENAVSDLPPTPLDSVLKALFQLVNAQTTDNFIELLTALSEWLASDPNTSPSAQVVIRYVESYLLRHNTPELIDYLDILRGQNMKTFAARFAEERDQQIEKALNEGIQKGTEKGSIRGRLTTLKSSVSRLCKRRFGAETATEIDALLSEVTHPDALEDLIDIILDALDGPDFLNRTRTHLQTFPTPPLSERPPTT